MTLNTDKCQTYITKSKRYEHILVYLQTDIHGTDVVIQALNRFVSSGATSVTLTAYPSGAHRFCSIFSFLCSILSTIVCILYFFFCQLYCLCLSSVFIVLPHWNYSPLVDMLLNLDTLSRFRATHSLLLNRNISWLAWETANTNFTCVEWTWPGHRTYQLLHCWKAR